MKITLSILSVIFSAIVYSDAVLGQTLKQTADTLPELSTEERAALGELFGTYSSATATFTGLDSISSGRVSVDPGDVREKAKLSIVRLPYTHYFGEKGDTIRGVGKFVLGHFEGTADDHTFSDELKNIYRAQGLAPGDIKADVSHDEATSLTLGAGIAFTPTKGLTIVPAFDMIWTHIRRMWDYNNDLSKLFIQQYDRELFNTSLEALSYTPSLKAGYEIPVTETATVTPSLKYAHLWSYDMWSKSTLADFSVSAGVFQSTVESSIKTPLCFLSLPMGVHPFITRTDLSGAALDGLGVKTFYDLGADLVFDTTEANSFFKEVSIGGSYLFGKNFEGFRVGLGLDF
jgi:hypothetical protein